METENQKITPRQVEEEITSSKPFLDDETPTKDAKSWREAEEAKIHIAGLKDFYTHRNGWSWFIMIAIGVLIGFQIVLTASIGFKWLDFSNYKIILGIIVSENFAQIVGLGFIVVKYLFNDDKNSKK